MTALQERLLKIRNEVDHKATLVAVSKFHPIEKLLAAYEAGQRVFGESRVQELEAKRKTLPTDVEWHFIGHLQTNKVKYIAPYVGLIHAVDSWRLLEEIDRQAQRCDRRIRCLLQLHVAQEESKYGFSAAELRQLLDEGEWRKFEYAQISGLMCMASFTDNTAQIAAEFAQAAALFDWAKGTHFADAAHFCLRSWGMSDDYKIALEQGSNLVRIGSTIFGDRV